MMKEPQISDFSLSDEIYQLIKLEHSDNLTDKYMLIYAYKEPKRKLRNRIITIILLAIIAALIFMACRHFELSIFSSICLLLILLYPIGIGIVIILGVIDKHLVENPTDEIKQNELYLCTVKVEVSKIKMESQKEYEDKGCPKGIF